MGGSQQIKKHSPGRTGGGRLTLHTPRHTQKAGRAGHTSRSFQSRAAGGRKQAMRPSQTHAHRSSSAQGSLTRAGNGHTHAHVHSHAHLQTHADQGGCGLFCYLCYGGYCLCLTLLSFFLLVLLSPPTSRPPPPSPPHSTSTPDDTSLDDCFSSLSVPFCPHPSLNLSSIPAPFLSSTDSLLHLFSDFNLSSSLPLCSSPSPAPSRTPSKSSSKRSPRPFLLVPPSLLLLPRPSICRPPSSSSRSLPTLLLCPHSLPDHGLYLAATVDHIPVGATPRPRTLLRQQSLQQPLIQVPAPSLSSGPPNSQSLGQLHTQPGSGAGGGTGPGGGPGGGTGTQAGGGASLCRSGGAGGRASRGDPGSVDHMMVQIKKRGLDVKSFL